jgi:hypothetical protein
MECPQCKSEKLPHKLCPVCGYYNGKQVLDFEAKKVKKAERKKKGRQ